MTTIHIRRPRKPEFVVRVRRSGARKYEVVIKVRTLESATRKLGAAFALRSDCKRGDVLMCEEWYEPVQMVEVVRR